MVNMHTTRRWSCLPAAGLGLALATLAGCQTWVPTAGLTLPSPHYLEHPPQYIPPSPAFPLTRELATQEAISARVAGAGAAAPLPPPVPGAPSAAPPPPPPQPAPIPAPAPAPMPGM
jgi:hypothetical protein